MLFDLKCQRQLGSAAIARGIKCLTMLAVKAPHRASQNGGSEARAGMGVYVHRNE